MPAVSTYRGPRIDLRKRNHAELCIVPHHDNRRSALNLRAAQWCKALSCYGKGRLRTEYNTEHMIGSVLAIEIE